MLYNPCYASGFIYSLPSVLCLLSLFLGLTYYPSACLCFGASLACCFCALPSGLFSPCLAEQWCSCPCTFYICGGTPAAAFSSLLNECSCYSAHLSWFGSSQLIWHLCFAFCWCLVQGRGTEGGSLGWHWTAIGHTGQCCSLLSPAGQGRAGTQEAVAWSHSTAKCDSRNGNRASTYCFLTMKMPWTLTATVVSWRHFQRWGCYIGETCLRKPPNIKISVLGVKYRHF